MFLYSKTVRIGTGLGQIDITMQREDPDTPPTHYYMSYIEDGEAKVAVADAANPGNFVYRSTLGVALSTAIEFNGQWKHTASGGYGLVTDDAPWAFWIDSNNILWGKQLIEQPTLLKMSTDAVKITCVRGWHNTVELDIDQGLICLYSKKDGFLYYRNYCYQPDGSYAWDTEHKIEEITESIVDFNPFRTNDYRVGILYETSTGQIKWLISTRNWAGMAIPPEHLSVGLTDLAIDVIPIRYYDTKEEENISVGISDLYIGCAIPITPIISSITNDVKDMYHITVKFSGAIYESLENRQSAFTLKDSLGTVFEITGTTVGVDQTEMIITTANYGSSKNPMTLSYNNGVIGNNLIPLLTVLKDNVHFAIPSGDTLFTASVQPPTGYESENINVGLTNLTIMNTRVYYSSANNGFENVGIGLIGLSIVVTKVGSNPL